MLVEIWILKKWNFFLKDFISVFGLKFGSKNANKTLRKENSPFFGFSNLFDQTLKLGTGFSHFCCYFHNLKCTGDFIFTMDDMQCEYIWIILHDTFYSFSKLYVLRLLWKIIPCCIPKSIRKDLTSVKNTCGILQHAQHGPEQWLVIVKYRMYRNVKN